MSSIQPGSDYAIEMPTDDILPGYLQHLSENILELNVKFSGLPVLLVLAVDIEVMAYIHGFHE